MTRFTPPTRSPLLALYTLLDGSLPNTLARARLMARQGALERDIRCQLDARGKPCQISATIQSQRHRRTTYRVKIDLEHRTWHCDCRAALYQRPACCKHVTLLASALVLEPERWLFKLSKQARWWRTIHPSLRARRLPWNTERLLVIPDMRTPLEGYHAMKVQVVKTTRHSLKVLPLEIHDEDAPARWISRASVIVCPSSFDVKSDRGTLLLDEDTPGSMHAHDMHEVHEVLTV